MKVCPTAVCVTLNDETRYPFLFLGIAMVGFGILTSAKGANPAPRESDPPQ